MRDFDAIRAALQRPPNLATAPDARRAGVAMVLDHNGHVLFIRRADRHGDPWSGHVGLPGGHEEPKDGDLRQTARRETHEELGLVLPDDSWLGQLDDIPTRPGLPSRIIQPHVFVVPKFESLSLEPGEVQSVHPFTLEALLANEGRTQFVLERGPQRYTLPAVDFPEGVRLWGLTLQIVDDLLHRLDGRGRGLARLA